MNQSSDPGREEISELAFEEAYRRLEDTVSRLELGEMSLADSERLYLLGLDLAKRCQQLLSETEMRISQAGAGSDLVDMRREADPGGEAGAWDAPFAPEPDDPMFFEDAPEL